MARPKSTHCVDCGKDLELDPCYTISHGETSRRAKCKECFNAKQRKANLTDPDKIRNTQLRYKYGISLEEYNKLLEAQGNVCAICKQSCTSGRDLGTDHNHSTGEVRGLLCHRCNRAVGLLREDPNILLDAYEYLTKTTWNKGFEKLKVGE